MATRPSVEATTEAYSHLFHSGLSLSKVKDAALGGRLFPSSHDVMGVTGRSMAWKLFLGPSEPLQRPEHSPPAPPLHFLRTSRKEYTKMLLDKMRAPDGSYADGFIVPGMSTFPERVVTPGNLETNNPLSLHNENPWTDWFAFVDLRKTIQQDVERTFPDIGYFRDTDVQTQLTNVLFLYSTTHPDIGYRQGMHELLAPLYYAVDYDSLPEDGSSQNDIREFCSRTWVAADAWTLFVAVMRGVGRWYEWRDSPSQKSGSIPSPLARHVLLDVPDGQPDTKPYMAPIVDTCNRIQSSLLRSVDPLLWKSMQGAGIEPQIYGIRWLRLLFTREFRMHDAMILWDGIFACDPTFELVPWICVSMLIRIRNKSDFGVIPSDYTTQLTYLLRYPPPPSVAASDVVNSPHHATLLLRQALHLQMAPAPPTGSSVVVENRNLLNIPLDVPSPRMSRRTGHGLGDKLASEERSGDTSGSKATHAKDGSSQQFIGLPEMIARGLLDKGESLGINRTLMSAVSDLRKNIPDLAASLVRTPALSASYAAFPLTDERLSGERPPWEPRTRFEMEKDISDLRTRNKRLGESINWIVDVLLQDEGSYESVGQVRSIQSRKREALECLSYVRDVLNGNVMEIEEERLIGTEEVRNRKLKAREASSTRIEGSVQIDAPKPAAPEPAVLESRQVEMGKTSSQSGLGRSFRFPPKSSTFTPSQPSGTIRTSPVPSLPSPSQPPSISPSSSPRLPPWNYTRSNFVAPSPPVASSLPRMPPPTSTTARPRVSSPTTPPYSPASPEFHPSPTGSQDMGQPKHRTAQQRDPLGVME